MSQDFQRGHAVSAARAAIGLGLLTLGRGLRHDPTYSSPLGRPLSFLAVGLLLLASVFFYQRLSERMAGRDVKPA